MSVIDDQFKAASVRMARTPAFKLLDPGIHRFMQRWMARRRANPSPLTAHLFFGGDMTVVLPEVISEALYTYGLFDEAVTWMALKALRPGDIVFDVGAHFGYFSLLFAHLVGSRGRVISFEPTPSSFAILEQNARRSDRVEPVNRAAADVAGDIEIADFGVRYSAWNTLAEESRMPEMLAVGSVRRVKIQAVRLDVFACERELIPDFIKIDAENFEHAVVAGLAGILDRARPVVLLESGSESALAAGHELMARGYSIMVSDGPDSLYAWDGVLADANARHKDLLFVPAVRLATFALGASQ